MTVQMTLLPKKLSDTANLVRIGYQDKELLISKVMVEIGNEILGYYVYNRQVHAIKNSSAIGLLVQQFLKEQPE